MLGRLGRADQLHRGVGQPSQHLGQALGLAAARRGKRTLIAMTNVKERMSHMLDVPPIGSQIVRVAPNLDVVNMDPQAALEEYGIMVLKVRALYKAVFENRVVRNFLRGTPTNIVNPGALQVRR